MSYLFFGGLKDVPVAATVKEVLKQLGDGSLQGSVSEVLDICRSISNAKDALSDPDFKALRDQSPFTAKVWSKLLQVGMDDRFDGIKEHLPASYTTLHLIHCFNDEELQAGVKEGHIHPMVSQGALNRWIKSYRFEDAAEEVPDDFSTLVSVLGPKEVEETVLERFKGDLEKLVGVYGFRTNYGDDQSMVALRQKRSQDKAGEVAALLTQDLRSTWSGASKEHKKQFSLASLDDLVQAPMTTFTGFLNKVREGRDGFWSFHANDYIRKITLEYLKAPSRGQRFNYRRRLKEVADKHTHLASRIQETLDTDMVF